MTTQPDLKGATLCRLRLSRDIATSAKERIGSLADRLFPNDQHATLSDGFDSGTRPKTVGSLPRKSSTYGISPMTFRIMTDSESHWAEETASSSAEDSWDNVGDKDCVSISRSTAEEQPVPMATPPKAHVHRSAKTRARTRRVIKAKKSLGPITLGCIGRDHSMKETSCHGTS